MKTHLFANVLQYGAGALGLIAALSSSGCIQDDPSARYTGNIIAETSAGPARIVFVDEGDGQVGVAEISKVGRASVVLDMLQRDHASPLEIFLATVDEDEEVPEILVENHRDIALDQAREDLAPRRLAPLQGEREPSASAQTAFTYSGTTSCTSTGWEGGSGVWGNPVDSWDVVFTNTTTSYSNNVTYPRTKSITQQATWNGGSGSFHSHGACISTDSGADNKITFTVFKGFPLVFSTDLFENVGDDDYIIYNDYISTNGTTTTSKISNVNSSSATFRHSAAAWVPIPQ